MRQPWLKAIFHHSWRPASSVLFRDKIWDTFERSGVIKCHFGRIKQCKCMVGFHIVTLEDDGISFTCSTCSTQKNWHLTNNHVGKWWIPHRKLTGQRKITYFFKGDTSSIKRLFVRCHVGFRGCFTDGFSPWFSQWWSCQVTEGSEVTTLGSSRNVAGSCQKMYQDLAIFKRSLKVLVSILVKDLNSPSNSNKW